MASCFVESLMIFLLFGVLALAAFMVGEHIAYY